MLVRAHKFDLGKRSGGDCSAMPKGKGPVPSPDSPYAFLNSEELASAANKAPTPSGYKQSFKNLHASTTANGYLGYVALDSYDTTLCASKCDEQESCQAINIFFERNPTLQVGSECPNPPSTTYIKCVFWGDLVTKDNTNNTGYTNNAFLVVAAGSNGYNNQTAKGVEG